MNHASSHTNALGRGTPEINREVGIEIIREDRDSKTSSPTSQPAEVRAAQAIPAILGNLQEVEGKFHKIIFRAVVDLYQAAHEEEIHEWRVEDKPTPPVRVEKKKWFNF